VPALLNFPFAANMLFAMSSLCLILVSALSAPFNTASLGAIATILAKMDFPGCNATNAASSPFPLVLACLSALYCWLPMKLSATPTAYGSETFLYTPSMSAATSLTMFAVCWFAKGEAISLSNVGAVFIVTLISEAALSPSLGWW